MSDLPEPIPAATLVLMRPGPDAPELLVMERAAHMAFAAGALVFPGGRIDPDDHRLAERYSDWPDAAARIAVIRETLEETGLTVGIVPAPDPAMAGKLRARLREDIPFSRLLEQVGLGLDLSVLTCFARWCPTFRETRRFDTLFFVAEAPPGAPEPIADADEAVRLFWASATAVLEEAKNGRARIIFPTRRNLERLARFASIDEARADAARYPVRKVVPWIEKRDSEQWLCIPEGIGYPVTAELLETARRT